MLFRKYRLRDGSIYWHKLYFDLVPIWMTKYAPPLGDYNYAAYLYQPHNYVIALWDHAKWFIQRGTRGYADCDVWGLDSYLTEWMPRAVMALRRKSHGAPLGVRVKVWNERLVAIADGFVAARELQDLKYEYPSAGHRAAWRRFDRGMRLFHKHFFDLWN